jgi:hypothetical protein
LIVLADFLALELRDDMPSVAIAIATMFKLESFVYDIVVGKVQEL